MVLTLPLISVIRKGSIRLNRERLREQGYYTKQDINEIIFHFSHLTMRLILINVNIILANLTCQKDAKLNLIN